MARSLAALAAVLSVSCTGAIPTVRESRFRASTSVEVTPAELAPGAPVTAPAVPVLYDMGALRCDPGAGYPKDWDLEACHLYEQAGSWEGKATSWMTKKIESQDAAAKQLGLKGKLDDTCSAKLTDETRKLAWVVNGPMVLAAEACDAAHTDVANGGAFSCVDFDRWNPCMSYRKDCAASKKDTAEACRAHMNTLREKALADPSFDAHEASVVAATKAACPDGTSEACKQNTACTDGNSAPNGPACKAYQKHLKAAYATGATTARSVVKTVYYDMLALYNAIRDTVVSLKYVTDAELRSGGDKCGKPGSMCYEQDAYKLDAMNPRLVATTPAGVSFNGALAKSGLGQATVDLIIALRRTLGAAKDGNTFNLWGHLFDAAGAEGKEDVRSEFVMVSSLISPKTVTEAIAKFRTAVAATKTEWAAFQSGGKIKPELSLAKAIALDIQLFDALEKATCNVMGGQACGAGNGFYPGVMAWLRVLSMRRYDFEFTHPLLTTGNNAKCFGDSGMKNAVLLRDGKSLPLAYPAVPADDRKCPGGAKAPMAQFEELWATQEKAAKDRADKAAAASTAWVTERNARFTSGKY